MGRPRHHDRQFDQRNWGGDGLSQNTDYELTLIHWHQLLFV